MPSVKPRLSVLMPVFNGGRFLDSAIKSILGQSFRDFELVIVDDGSTDNSSYIISNIKDSRIKYIRAQHGGLTNSLAIALDNSTGEFVARMDADDISHPNRFDHQVSYLDSNPGIHILCSDAIIIDEAGRRVGQEVQRGLNNDLLKDGLLNRRSIKPIIHPSVMLRREVFDRVGGYRDFPHCEDHDLWLRCVDLFRFHRVNEFLIKYRIHAGGVSRAKYRTQMLSNCMSSVTYLVKHEANVDIFDDEPELFRQLQCAMAVILETQVLSRSAVYRELREAVRGKSRIALVIPLLHSVITNGLGVLPPITRMNVRCLIESTVRSAVSHLASQSAERKLV